MSKRFKDWFEDGNVEEIDGGYTTQDSQWTNRIKDIPSLYAYWLKEFGCAIILLMMLTSCAKEPLEFSYDSFRELRTYDLSLNQLLRDGTEDWVENNMSDLKPYQTEFFNKVVSAITCRGNQVGSTIGGNDCTSYTREWMGSVSVGERLQQLLRHQGVSKGYGWCKILLG